MLDLRGVFFLSWKNESLIYLINLIVIFKVIRGVFLLFIIIENMNDMNDFKIILFLYEVGVYIDLGFFSRLMFIEYCNWYVFFGVFWRWLVGRSSLGLFLLVERIWFRILKLV